MKYAPVEPKEHPQQITINALQKLGFVYNMGIWSKDGFSIQFYKYMWKCSVKGSPEFDIVYLSDLYKKYWELTGKILPPLI